MSMEVKTIDGIPVRVWSEGEGEPLVYLHGHTQQMGGAGFLKRLAGKRRVIAPELPGFGETGGFESLHDITDLVLRLRRVVEALSDAPVDLVGHSLGGMFAAEVAAFHPRLVKRLVLVNSFGLWLDDHPLPDPFVLLPNELAEVLWHEKDPAAIAELEKRMPEETPQVKARNLGAATKFMWPLPDRGLSRRLRYIEAPTLVLHGASDRLVLPPYADALAAGINGAQARKIEGAGHFPMIEAEDAFVREVESFLDTPVAAARKGAYV